MVEQTQLLFRQGFSAASVLATNDRARRGLSNVGTAPYAASVRRETGGGSKQFNIRLAGEELDELRRRCDQLGTSATAYLRELIRRELLDHERLELLEAVHSFDGKLDRLRSELATTLETILLNSNPKLTAEQVRSWVAENLRAS